MDHKLYKERGIKMQSVAEKIWVYKTLANLEMDDTIGTAANDRQISLEKLYQAFCNANDYYPAKETFHDLCKGLALETGQAPLNYQYFREYLCGNTTKDFFNLLDQKASQQPYKNQPCKGKRVLIIGGGPCGLRAAIEISLLGGQPIVVERRDYFSRNNVANLWDFVVKDLKSIGAKVLQKDLCVRHDRAGIKIIQLALFKISLLLGGTYYCPAEFRHILTTNKDNGWRAVVLNMKTRKDFEIPFDFVIGADGKKNSLEFCRTKHPMTLAIGITCNFVYNNTTEEIKIASDKQGAVSRIYRQELFKSLQEKGFDLENIVYFVDKTHYFIFTAKKECLLRKGVLKSLDGGENGLLHPNNVDMNQLERFSFELVQHITDHKLPNLQFATNHHSTKDINIFDFTNFFQAEQACRVVDYEGSKLLQQIVGDTLIEPFWPIGSGMALGFLSVFDAVWTIRNWCLGAPANEVEKQRKDIFAHMTKINHDGLRKHSQNFTIDPDTRYKMRPNSLLFTLPAQWQKGQDSQERSHSYFPRPPVRKTETTGLERKEQKSTPTAIFPTLGWFQFKLAPFKSKFTIENLTTDWYDGRALCALVHLYRPDLISLDKLNSLDPNERVKNKKFAFDHISKVYGLMTPEDVLKDEPYNILPEYLCDLWIKLRQLDENKTTRKGPPRRRRPKTTVIDVSDIKKAETFTRTRALSTEDIPNVSYFDKEKEQDSPKHVAYTSVFLTKRNSSPSNRSKRSQEITREPRDRANINVIRTEADNYNNSNALHQVEMDSHLRESKPDVSIEKYLNLESDSAASRNPKTIQSNIEIDSSRIDSGEQPKQESFDNENKDEIEDTNQTEADRDTENRNSHNASPIMESDTSKQSSEDKDDMKAILKHKEKLTEVLRALDIKINEMDDEEERLLKECLEVRVKKKNWKKIKDTISAHMQSLPSEFLGLSAEESDLETLVKTTHEELQKCSFIDNESNV